MSQVLNFASQCRLFERGEAEATAAELQTHDPDWTYTAVHDPKGTGLSYIQITDEEGLPLGKVCF